MLPTIPDTYLTKTFTEAVKPAFAANLSADDRKTMNQLNKRIPEGMRAMFKFMFTGSEGSPVLYGLMITPNEALEEIGNFKQKFNPRSGFKQHSDYQSYVLSGDRLRYVLEHPDHKVLAPVRGSESGTHARQCLTMYYGSDPHYYDTLPLKEVLHLNGLSFADRTAAEKILGNISPHARDTFYAIVAQHGDQFKITGIGIDTQLNLHLINEGLLRDIARIPELSCPVGPARSRNEAPMEINHPVTHTFVSGENIAQNLAARLPAVGSARFTNYD